MRDPVMWALDLETGGLDARRDAILAVGMVPVRDGTIRLGEAYSTLVRAGGAISAASVPVHQLVPRDVVGAPLLGDVLREIDRRLDGATLLVHQAAVDVAFLKRAHEVTGLRWPRPRVVDTVDLIIRAARFLYPTEPEPPLDLGAARRRHGLPEYPLHDALTDAIATAELFLVLRGLT